MRLLMALALPLLFTTAAFAQAGEGEGEGEGEGAPPPQGWLCPASFYGDGGCDCGCGKPDIDCADANLATCEFNSCGSQTPPPAGLTHPVPSKTDTTTCVENTCGDGVVVGSLDGGTEECDDGNTTAGDGCSATCTVEPNFDCSGGSSTFLSTCAAVVCGDGKITGQETCDDGNATAGDGCSATCQTETGFACPTPGQACIAVPAAWTCDPNFYGAGPTDGCDCGCGAPDPDCAPNTTAADCEADDPSTGFDDCPTGQHVDPSDITKCVNGAPPGGEGEGEGEGAAAGEGEGAAAGGEGEGEGSANPTPKPSCNSTPVSSSAGPASLVLVLGLGAMMRRRRR